MRLASSRWLPRYRELFDTRHKARTMYYWKDCFGETPKPARETRALPRKFLERFDQIPRQRPDPIENAVGNWFRR